MRRRAVLPGPGARRGIVVAGLAGAVLVAGLVAAPHAATRRLNAVLEQLDTQPDGQTPSLVKGLEAKAEALDRLELVDGAVEPVGEAVRVDPEGLPAGLLGPDAVVDPAGLVGRPLDDLALLVDERVAGERILVVHASMVARV